jgi:hypothetical protein
MLAGVAGGLFAGMSEAAAAFVAYPRSFTPDRGRRALLAAAFDRWRRAA